MTPLLLLPPLGVDDLSKRLRHTLRNLVRGDDEYRCLLQR